MMTKPWQIVALATLCFIQAVHFLGEVLSDLLIASNPESVEDLSELGFSPTKAGSAVDNLYDYLANSQYVFTIMLVVIFMFGFLLYRGEYLPAVRLTGTIFFAVGLAGQLLFAGRSGDGTVLDTEVTFLLYVGLNALLLLGFISLFFGKSAQWVKEHADSK